MMAKRNEVSYYPEIMDFIKSQIESNFKASKNPLKVYCKTGELKKGLAEIISENGITTKSIIDFANSTPPLSLDIFALITDGVDFELLILEVKLLENVGLAQLSQLIGYCIVSNAQYGLLINVNGGESPRLVDLLSNEPDVTYIRRMLAYSSRLVEHNLGVMEWDSDVQNLYYSGYGRIQSISKLCEMLAAKFTP
jgi:hypothetical protein